MQGSTYCLALHIFVLFLFLAGIRQVMVSPSSCLERGVTYTLSIDFSRYRSDRATPEASILIDSVSLRHVTLDCYAPAP